MKRKREFEYRLYLEDIKIILLVFLGVQELFSEYVHYNI